MPQTPRPHSERNAVVSRRGAIKSGLAAAVVAGTMLIAPHMGSAAVTPLDVNRMSTASEPVGVVSPEPVTNSGTSWFGLWFWPSAGE